jgi:hypothetical protein
MVQLNPELSLCFFQQPGKFSDLLEEIDEHLGIGSKVCARGGLLVKVLINKLELRQRRITPLVGELTHGRSSPVGVCQACCL